MSVTVEILPEQVAQLALAAALIKAMASPTTAGKGCEPLYENSGGGRVGGAPPPQAESQDKLINTRTKRIGITTQFALQPIVENVTTELAVLYCPSKVIPDALFE